MIRLRWNRTWPLCVAIALAAASSSIRGGQGDSNEMVFMPPTVAQDGAADRINQLLELQRRNSVKASAPGKAAVPQGATAKTQKSVRNPALTTDPSRDAIGRSPVSNKTPATNQQISTAKPAPQNATGRNSSIVQASSTGTDTGVTPASHANPMQGVTPDGADPLLLKERKKHGPNAIPIMTMPAERNVVPAASGELLGLKGVTATERLLQMRAVAIDLERENEELRQQNAGLMSRLKESHEQLTAGVREIQMARKELGVARGDLDRLKTDLQNLREKVRIAEREYSAVLQSMGPLLQQLLESDDVSALPPNPTE